MRASKFKERLLVASVASRPQNFIPYIGPLVSGYDTKSSAVTFVFDSKGVLRETSSSQNNMGSGARSRSPGIMVMWLSGTTGTCAKASERSEAALQMSKSHLRYLRARRLVWLLRAGGNC